MNDRRRLLISAGAGIGKTQLLLHQEIINQAEKEGVIIVLEQSEELITEKIKKHIEFMEPKIKDIKELKVQVSEEENGVGRRSSYTMNTIDTTAKQKKARAKAKRAKQARNINHKNNK